MSLHLDECFNYLIAIDLIIDSDVILNFCSVDFYVLILGSLSNFTFLWRLWPWKYSHIPCGEWEFYNIGQNPSSSIFMKNSISTSEVIVFIQVQNLLSSENDWTSWNFTHPRIVLTRNHNFKIPVNLLESTLYLLKIRILTQFWTKNNPNLLSPLHKINR